MTHPADQDRDATFEVRRAFWGYAVRCQQGLPVLVQVAQGLVLAVGATCVASALTLLHLAQAGAGVSAMHLGAGVLLLAVAVLLLHYASRGGVVELHVDLARGELREVVLHRIGTASLVSRHDFDPSASLHIRRAAGDDAGRELVLFHRGNPHGLCLARGPESALRHLRWRLEHDMRLTGQPQPLAA